MADKAKLRRETILRDICLSLADSRMHGRVVFYDRSAHLYRFAEDARSVKSLKFAPRDPYAVVAGAEGERLWAAARGEQPFFDLPVEDVLGQVAFGFPEERFQPFVEGILRRKAVALDYLSKNGPMFATFSPHTIVKTAFRVHIRGYAYWRDGVDNRFIDIIPGRVMEAKIDPLAGYVGASNDADWNERVSLQATVRPEVPPDIVDTLNREYAASGGQFTILGVRRAMTEYVTQALESRRVRGFEGSVLSVAEK